MIRIIGFTRQIPWRFVILCTLTISIEGCIIVGDVQYEVPALHLYGRTATPTDAVPPSSSLFNVVSSRLEHERDTLLSIADASMTLDTNSTPPSQVEFRREQSRLLTYDGSSYITSAILNGKIGSADIRSRVLFLWQPDKPVVYRIHQRKSNARVSVADLTPIRDQLATISSPRDLTARKLIWKSIDWRDTEAMVVEFVRTKDETMVELDRSENGVIEVGLIFTPHEDPTIR